MRIPRLSYFSLNELTKQNSIARPFTKTKTMAPVSLTSHTYRFHIFLQQGKSWKRIVHVVTMQPGMRQAYII